MSLDIEFKSFTTGGPKHVLNPPNVMLFCGPTGSGKTTTALHVLEEINNVNDDLDSVHFVTANRKDKLLKILGKDVEVISDTADLLNLIAEIKQEGESPHRVIVIDDCAAFKSLFNSMQFFDFVLSHRHHNVQLLITSQGWNQIPKQIRSQATLLFIYPVRNIKQKKDLISELAVDSNKLNQGLALIERGSGKNFIMIQNRTGKPRLFHNFTQEL